MQCPVYNVGAPGRPVILSDHVTAVSVNLTWRSGFHGGSRQTFNVQYKMTGDPEYITDGQVIRDPGYRETTWGFISNLSEQTDYEFRVRAQNEFADLGSSYSDVKMVKTRSKNLSINWNFKAISCYHKKQIYKLFPFQSYQNYHKEGDLKLNMKVIMPF